MFRIAPFLQPARAVSSQDRARKQSVPRKPRVPARRLRLSAEIVRSGDVRRSGTQRPGVRHFDHVHALFREVRSGEVRSGDRQFVGTALVPMALSDMGVLEGAGEIISTGNDMARFLRVLAGLAPFTVAGAVE